MNKTICKINICKCGCNNLAPKYRSYIPGHNLRADKISKSTKGKTYKERYGIKKTKNIILNHKKGQKNKIVSEQTKKKLSIINRKYTNKEILDNLLFLFNRYPMLKKSDLYGAGKFKNFVCHESSIRKRFGSFDNAAKYINKEFNIKDRWEIKEKFIGEVLQFFYKDIKYQIYHKNIGWPDFETEKEIYEVKSTLNDIKIEQIRKYKKIGKKIFIVVFENRGNTIINKDRIIDIDNLIIQMPNKKRDLFFNKKEMILNAEI